MSTNKRSFFRAALDGLVEARQREANRHVNGALLMLDDKTLKAYGYDRKELKKRGDARFYF